MADFASMLKYLREREGLSQRDLAEQLGISKSTISMYEMGRRHPKFEDEEAIADFFNVDLNTLRGKRVSEPMPEDTPQAKAIRAFYSSFSDEQIENTSEVELSMRIINYFLKAQPETRTSLLNALEEISDQS